MKKIVIFKEGINVPELANQMGVSNAVIIKAFNATRYYGKYKR